MVSDVAPLHPVPIFLVLDIFFSFVKYLDLSYKKNQELEIHSHMACQSDYLIVFGVTVEK